MKLVRRLNNPQDGAAVAPLEAAQSLLHATLEPEASAQSVAPHADKLARADLSALQTDVDRTAFWLNVYNALMRHVLLALNPGGSVTTRLHLFFLVHYRVGPFWMSLQHMEHGVLRRNARMTPMPARAFGNADARSALMVSRLDARIHFALNCGAVSCPPIKSYSPDVVDAQLRLATQGYFAQHCHVDIQRRHVELPHMCRVYKEDFGGTAGALAFAADHLEGANAAWLTQHLASVTTSYGRYNWTLVPAH